MQFLRDGVQSRLAADAPALPMLAVSRCLVHPGSARPPPAPPPPQAAVETSTLQAQPPFTHRAPGLCPSPRLGRSVPAAGQLASKPTLPTPAAGLVKPTREFSNALSAGGESGGNFRPFFSNAARSCGNFATAAFSWAVASGSKAKAPTCHPHRL